MCIYIYIYTHICNETNGMCIQIIYHSGNHLYQDHLCPCPRNRLRLFGGLRAHEGESAGGAECITRMTIIIITVITIITINKIITIILIITIMIIIIIVIVIVPVIIGWRRVQRQPRGLPVGPSDGDEGPAGRSVSPRIYKLHV